uniref:Rapamycin-insensitive companion of mTOR N-terminal domain-containing protein n=1 Tax=Gouania willdenowi TaxID=441366 RepID=A0A8C5E1Q1_GOUWI
YSKRRQKEFAGIVSRKSRTHQSDQQMPLKKTEPKENLQEILENIVKQDGISCVCKLCHLNNFVKLLCSVGIAEDKLGFTYEEIIICLRLTLLNEAREVRVAGLQSFRYLIRDSNVLGKVLLLQVDYLIARFIDIQQNDSERTQALRLARKVRSPFLHFFSNLVIDLTWVLRDRRGELSSFSPSFHSTYTKTRQRAQKHKGTIPPGCTQVVRRQPMCTNSNVVHK